MSEKVSLKLDPDALTLGDMEDFEDVTGKTIEEVLRPQKVYENGKVVKDDKGRPVTEVHIPSKALVALVWVVNRQSNPDFTLADARKVRVGDLEITDGDEDSEGND
jgi:hypothetical protein